MPLTNAFGALALDATLKPINTSGSITTQNLVPAGAATASSSVEISPAGRALLAIQVTGTYTGALSVQVTVDGSTWVTTTSATGVTNKATQAQSATIASAALGVFLVSVDGAAKVRVSALAAVTGTATVTLVASNDVALVGLDAPLPAGSSVVGGVTQSGTWTVNPSNTPNTTAWLANPLTPAVSTTGDTGAKTATGNGATQTNATSKGAHVIVNLGAVTGTTPTAVFKIQGSADGGTTWFDVPGATTASLIATGVYGVTIYPGIAATAATTTSGTTAAVSGVLPRSWRVVWTIGGTTPSFTITNIQVSYLI